MRIIVFLIFLIGSLLASDFINGKVSLVPITKNVSSVLVREQNVPIFKMDKNFNYALIAVPYRQEKDLKIEIVKSEKRETKIFNIKKGEYPSEVLQVDPVHVSPPEDQKERIKAEYEEAMALYKTFTKDRLWRDDFMVPLKSKITSAYGNARTFNDSLKSYHSGTDFRAAIGTPIYATNDGVVVLSKDRYYAGGSVILDHGEGVYSVYYHLSSTPLAVGTKVKKGEQIGLSGASGRVTGPHLHFGFMVQGVPVDPLHFIKTINDLRVSFSASFDNINTKNNNNASP